MNKYELTLVVNAKIDEDASGVITQIQTDGRK